MTKIPPDRLFIMSPDLEAAAARYRASQDKYKNAAIEFRDKRSQLTRKELAMGMGTELANMVANDFKINIHDEEEAKKLIDAVTELAIADLNEQLPQTDGFVGKILKPLLVRLIINKTDSQKNKIG